eukprot:scaffold553_cov238-Pinguiococcus_pyrenoidosus.AAC.6
MGVGTWYQARSYLGTTSSTAADSKRVSACARLPRRRLVGGAETPPCGAGEVRRRRNLDTPAAETTWRPWGVASGSNSPLGPRCCGAAATRSLFRAPRASAAASSPCTTLCARVRRAP